MTWETARYAGYRRVVSTTQAFKNDSELASVSNCKVH